MKLSIIPKQSWSSEQWSMHWLRLAKMSAMIAWFDLGSSIGALIKSWVAVAVFLMCCGCLQVVSALYYRDRATRTKS